MNPVLFLLLFALAWLFIYALIRHLILMDHLDFGKPLHWFPATVGAIIVILSVWGSYALIAAMYFAPAERIMRKGVIQKHQYDPPYTSHSFIMTGKVMVPTTHYHPARWWVLVDGKDNSDEPLLDWVDVGENTYSTYADSDSIYFKPQP